MYQHVPIHVPTSIPMLHATSAVLNMNDSELHALHYALSRHLDGTQNLNSYFAETIISSDTAIQTIVLALGSIRPEVARFIHSCSIVKNTTGVIIRAGAVKIYMENNELCYDTGGTRKTTDNMDARILVIHKSVRPDRFVKMDILRAIKILIRNFNIIKHH
jgi:hypothetical protein